MADPIEISPGVTVPADAIEMRAVRASGPGGQNVNKVASKVELRIDLGRVAGIDGAALGRLRALARRRLDRDGRLRVSSQRTRDQLRNLEDARERVRDLIAQALVTPTPRVASRPTAASRRRRLEEKRRRARIKSERHVKTEE